MPVHTLIVFDRKGKTLFTKCYKKGKNEQEEDEEQLSEQRKLVFGMLFSLREVVASLTPGDAKDKGLHAVRTGASTLYTYDCASGLRFALYTTGTAASFDREIQNSLKHIYNELWMNNVVRSPLYNPVEPNVSSTSFEQSVDSYLGGKPWYKA